MPQQDTPIKEKPPTQNGQSKSKKELRKDGMKGDKK